MSRNNTRRSARGPAGDRVATGASAPASASRALPPVATDKLAADASVLAACWLSLDPEEQAQVVDGLAAIARRDSDRALALLAGIAGAIAERVPPRQARELLELLADTLATGWQRTRDASPPAITGRRPRRVVACAASVSVLKVQGSTAVHAGTWGAARADFHVLTPDGYVVVSHAPADGPFRAHTEMRFIHAGLLYWRTVDQQYSARGLATVAARFAADCAEGRVDG